MATPARKRPADANLPRGRGRPVNHDGRKTHDAILQAATRLFGTTGFSNVSLSAIAAESDVHERAIYHHFASKRALFEAARAGSFDKFVHEVRSRAFRHAKTRDRVDGYVAVYRHLNTTDPDVLRLIGMAIVDGLDPTRSESLVDAGAELFGLIATMLDDGIANGEINPEVDSQGALELFSAISMGMSLLAVANTGAYPRMLDAMDMLTAGTFFTPQTKPRRRAT